MCQITFNERVRGLMLEEHCFILISNRPMHVELHVLLKISKNVRYIQSKKAIQSWGKFFYYTRKYQQPQRTVKYLIIIELSTYRKIQKCALLAAQLWQGTMYRPRPTRQQDNWQLMICQSQRWRSENMAEDIHSTATEQV